MKCSSLDAIIAPDAHMPLQVGVCWGPSASEGPQKHDLTMLLE
jgi:hypothetical protein